ncbi:hypothetical protein UP17_09095 [Peribacillus simplex]|nr:hypothetical protein UP17_09095 [Peribacillus simplex]
MNIKNILFNTLNNLFIVFSFQVILKGYDLKINFSLIFIEYFRFSLKISHHLFILRRIHLQ